MSYRGKCEGRPEFTTETRAWKWQTLEIVEQNADEQGGRRTTLDGRAAIPRKPYPCYDGIPRTMEVFDSHAMRAHRAEEFYDDSLLRELDESGFIDGVYDAVKVARTTKAPEAGGKRRSRRARGTRRERSRQVGGKLLRQRSRMVRCRRRIRAARPARPIPHNAIVAGSGTARSAASAAVV